MTKQICATFYRYLGDKHVDDQVNEYMEQHPTYRIQHVFFQKDPATVKEAVFVVFETEVVD